MENVRKYFKRDISWLSFNYRVLMEAMDHTVPLFDRIKFLSIYQSNQEEFYRVRVSEYHQLLSDPLQSIEDKRQDENTLSSINQEVNRQVDIFNKFFFNEIIPELEKEGIHSVGPTKSAAQIETNKAFMRKLFEDYDIPGSIKYGTFYDLDEAYEFIK